MVSGFRTSWSGLFLPRRPATNLLFASQTGSVEPRARRWYTRVPMDRPGQLYELPHPAHRAPRGVGPTA